MGTLLKACAREKEEENKRYVSPFLDMPLDDDDDDVRQFCMSFGFFCFFFVCLCFRGIYQSTAISFAGWCRGMGVVMTGVSRKRVSYGGAV